MTRKCHRLNHIDGRRRVASYYLEHIKNPKLILTKVVEQEGHVWHLFVIRATNRDALQQHLSEKGIQTLIHYPIPPYKQAAYKEFNYLYFPITEQIHEEVLSLPISGVITEKDLKLIVEQLNRY